MYQELHRWDECIAVAQAKVLPALSFSTVPTTQFHQYQKPLVKEAIATGTRLGLEVRTLVTRRISVVTVGL